jgi:hypothetical protein
MVVWVTASKLKGLIKFKGLDCISSYFFFLDIADNRVVHFYLMNDDVSLQYFMPVMMV